MADHHEYPLEHNPLRQQGPYPEHASVWLRSLFADDVDPKTGIMQDHDIFQCPCASRPKSFPVNIGYIGYGYNAKGVLGNSLDQWRGIGGLNLDAAGFGPPTKESAIKVPTEMVALGDGLAAWKDVIQDGTAKIGRTFYAKEFQGSTARSMKRHFGRMNLLFCDGHVAAMPITNALLSTNDAFLRIWNSDNEPHADRLR